jgi:hypothetical protein
MCLACAIPVRGRALGSECLAAALGPDAPLLELVGREPGTTARRIARASFGLAVVATLLPWSRFGPGSEPFGAWAAVPRWSMLAAVAAVAGLLLSVLGRWSPIPPHARDLAMSVAGAVVVAGSALALANPPAFTSPWLGPWVALLAGAAATAASLSAHRAAPEHEPAHV